MKGLSEIDYVVIDDIVDKDYQNYLELFFINPESQIQWYFYPTTNNPENPLTPKNCYDAPQFVHTFKDRLMGFISPHIDKPIYILDGLRKKTGLKDFNLLRLKSNLQIKKSENSLENFTQPHNDVPEDHYVLLYYVNDNDGYTFLFNDDLTLKAKINPKKGRAILFNGKILHASSHPINYETRIVLNFDLEIK
jgi:hypothetical protein